MNTKRAVIRMRSGMKLLEQKMQEHRDNWEGLAGYLGVPLEELRRKTEKIDGEEFRYGQIKAIQCRYGLSVQETAAIFLS